MWKQIKNYEDLYWISDDGRVKSRRGLRRLQTDKYGYKKVILSKNGKKKNHLVHRLIAEAFIENPFSKSEVNHKDGVKTNNLVENLEWATFEENRTHSLKIKIHKWPSGENNPRAKLTEENVIEIRASDLSVKALAELYGVARTTVYAILNHERWAHI